MFNRIDQWIDFLENGRKNVLTRDEKRKILAAKLNGLIGEEEILLLTGCATQKKLEELETHLQESLPTIQIISGRYFEESADTLQKARQCNAILFIEEKKFSTQAQVKRALSQFKEFGKPVIGFVMV